MKLSRCSHGVPVYLLPSPLCTDTDISATLNGNFYIETATPVEEDEAGRTRRGGRTNAGQGEESERERKGAKGSERQGDGQRGRGRWRKRRMCVGKGPRKRQDPSGEKGRKEEKKGWKREGDKGEKHREGERERGGGGESMVHRAQQVIS